MMGTRMLVRTRSADDRISWFVSLRSFWNVLMHRSASFDLASA